MIHGQYQAELLKIQEDILVDFMSDDGVEDHLGTALAWEGKEQRWHVEAVDNLWIQICSPIKFKDKRNMDKKNLSCIHIDLPTSAWQIFHVFKLLLYMVAIRSFINKIILTEK